MRFTLVTFVAVFSGFSAATPLRNLQSRAAKIGDYDYAGCFIEATVGRALLGKVIVDGLLTNEKCATACVGYKWFGTEYGQECYCGDSLSEGSKKVPEIECSFPCPGEGNQQCGAGNRLTTYALTGITTPNIDTPKTFKSIGCYTEATTGRALSGGGLADDTMTAAKCAAKCTGFSMFGLEYGRECFCGNELSIGSVKAPETDCVFPCSGNNAELCGAGLRLNVYTAEEGETPSAPDNTYARKGCYTDDRAARTLPDKVLALDDMTVETCSVNCIGYAWFGLEYGRECWCGNTINGNGQLTEDSECKFKCSGSDSQLCGASDRLDVYEFGAVSQSSSTVVSSSTAMSSSSSISSTTTTELVSSSTTFPAPITTSTSSTTSSTTTTTTASTTATTAPVPTQCTTIQTNLLVNGGFEELAVATSILGWTPTETSPQGVFQVAPFAPDAVLGSLCGVQTLQFRSGPNGGTPLSIVEQQIPGLTVGRQYRVTGYIRRMDVNPSHACNAFLYASSPIKENMLSLASTVTETEWKKLEGIWTANTDSALIRIMARCLGGGDIFFDQISFEPLPYNPVQCVPPPNGNLLPNPGFEDPVSPSGIIPLWSPLPIAPDPQGTFRGISYPAGDALCGNQVARYSATALTEGLFRPYVRLEYRFSGLIIGQQYKFTGHIRRVGLSPPSVLCDFGVNVSNESRTKLISKALNSVTTAAGWQSVTNYYIAQSPAGFYQLAVVCRGREDMYVDQMGFEAV